MIANATYQIRRGIRHPAFCQDMKNILFSDFTNCPSQETSCPFLLIIIDLCNVFCCFYSHVKQSPQHSNVAPVAPSCFSPALNTEKNHVYVV